MYQPWQLDLNWGWGGGGGSLSEPHLVSTAAALSDRTSSTRDRLLNTCTFNAGLISRFADLSRSQAYS